MNTQAASRAPRFLALDGLRGIAALLVVLVHVQWSNHITTNLFVTNGYLAVDLFFILSGLVISANYSIKIVDRRAAQNFITLRFFRLYPLHLAMLAAFVGLECLKLVGQRTLGIVPEHQPFTGGQSFLTFVANIFLVQGLGWMETVGFNHPSWSISCEFFAYVIFAVATLFGLGRSRICFIGTAILTVVAYMAIALKRGTLNVVLDFGIVRCLAGFFWGVLIFRWSGVLRGRSLTCINRYEVGVTAAVLVTMATISGPMILIVLPLFILLVAQLRSDTGPVARVLIAKPAQYLGRISYSIYMVHELFVVCMLMGLKRVAPMSYNPDMLRAVVAINPWIGDVLVLVLVVAVVIAASRSYALIEEPGRLFGRRVVQQSVVTHQPGRAAARVSVSPRSSERTPVEQQ